MTKQLCDVCSDRTATMALAGLLVCRLCHEANNTKQLAKDKTTWSMAQLNGHMTLVKGQAEKSFYKPSSKCKCGCGRVIHVRHSYK